MPLERIYCRIGFSFLFTGNSEDKIKIDKITIDKTSNQGYLFLEENEADNKTPLGSLVWSAAVNGPGVFKDAKGGTNTNGEQSTGGSLMTLYAESSSVAPLYFRTSFEFGNIDRGTVVPIAHLNRHVFQLKRTGIDRRNYLIGMVPQETIMLFTSYPP